MGSLRRMGRVDEALLSKEQLAKSRAVAGFATFIQVTNTPGFIGHSYFVSDPAVSSDLVVARSLRAWARGLRAARSKKSRDPSGRSRRAAVLLASSKLANVLRHLALLVAATASSGQVVAADSSNVAPPSGLSRQFPSAYLASGTGT